MDYSEFLPLYIGCTIAPFEDEGDQVLTVDNLRTAIEMCQRPYLRSTHKMTLEEGFKTLCLNQRAYNVIYAGVTDDSRYIKYRLQYPERVSKIYHQMMPVNAVTPKAMLYHYKCQFDLFDLVRNQQAKIKKEK